MHHARMQNRENHAHDERIQLSIKHIVWPILGGLLVALSQPIVIEPISVKPLDPTGLSGLLALIGYIPLFVLAQSATPRRVAFMSFLTIMAQLMTTIYWVVIALHVFGKVGVPFSVLTLGVLCLTFGSFFIVGVTAARALSMRFSWPFWAIVAPFVTAGEYLRNYIFFGGFPWGNIGYSFSTVPVLLQTASLVGVYGLVFLAVLFNGVVAQCIIAKRKHIGLPYVGVASILAIAVFAISFGVYRLNTFDVSALRKFQVALLQGNIEQGIKNKSELHAQYILDKFRRQQDEAVGKGAEVVIWPEASLPSRISLGAEALVHLGLPAPTTIAGGVMMEQKFDEASGKMNNIFYNSAIVLNENFDITGLYHKTHLVPFGEYVPWPFRNLVDKVVPGMGAFGLGSEIKPLKVSLGSVGEEMVGLTICYEGVFPEISRALAKQGANLLINMTNDAWYGVSSAPYQHLAMYSMRAVETGRYFARATNTGVSGIINPRGFVYGHTELYEDKVLVVDVPVYSESTFYLLIGDLVAQLSLIFAFGALVLAMVGKDVFLRRRHLTEWVLAFLGFGTAMGAIFHFTDTRFALVEAASTQMVLFVLFGLLVGTAALSGTRQGRSMLFWSGLVLALLSAFFSIFNGVHFLFASALGAMLCAISWLRRHAYTVLNKQA
jgi:apolipoprotein N-acyltransferase